MLVEVRQGLASRGADPTHRRNLFRLAYLSERVGQEQLALDAYETLGVEPEASDDDIKRASRRLSPKSRGRSGPSRGLSV